MIKEWLILSEIVNEIIGVRVKSVQNLRYRLYIWLPSDSLVNLDQRAEIMRYVNGESSLEFFDDFWLVVVVNRSKYSMSFETASLRVKFSGSFDTLMKIWITWSNFYTKPFKCFQYSFAWSLSKSTISNSSLTFFDMVWRCNSLFFLVRDSAFQNGYNTRLM